MGGNKLRQRVTWGLDLLTLGAIGFVILTLWKPTRDPTPPRSPVGREAPALELVDESGSASRELARAMVFVFRSDCPVCAAQKSNWATMAALAVARGFRVLAVTPEPVTGEIHDYFGVGLDIPVRQLASLDPLRQLGITQVPTTLIVDGRGIVRYREAGVVTVGDTLLQTFQ